MELCIIIEINLCGLINVGEMLLLFCVIWNLVISINPLAVRHPIEQCEMLIPSFLYLFRCRYHSWGSTSGAGKTSGCSWSGQVERVIFYCVYGIETCFSNYELWTCNETLFWLSCFNCELLFLDCNDNYYLVGNPHKIIHIYQKVIDLSMNGYLLI